METKAGIESPSMLTTIKDCILYSMPFAGIVISVSDIESTLRIMALLVGIFSGIVKIMKDTKKKSK